MFFPSHIASQVSSAFKAADRQVRLDLTHNRIVGERDYLFRWITLLEYPDSIPGTATFKYVKRHFVSNSFPGPLEQYFGCDLFFVFKYKTKIKLMLIEAKFPRFHITGYNWDGVKRGISHFDTQLQRQVRAFTLNPLILEMFIVRDCIQNSDLFYDAFGSSFVEHTVAYNHHLVKRIAGWKQTDASTAILNQSLVTGFVGIEHFVHQFLQCHTGNYHEIRDNQLEIKFRISNKINIDRN